MQNRYYSGPPSDHFDGTRFFNPGQPTSDRSLAEVLRWRFRGVRSRWPAVVAACSGLLPAQTVSGLRITCIGHASLLIQVAGMNLLVDPVWSDRASPFRYLGPRRHNPPAVALSDLPPIHAVLLTHNHYDHLDLMTLRQLWETHHPRLLTPLGNDTILRAAARDIEVSTGDWWDSFELLEGSEHAEHSKDAGSSGQVRATIVPSYHWSSRGFRDRRMALWGGFVLHTPRGVVYLAGDTGYGDGAIFREIGRRCGPPVVAALPIGAYAPRWFMQTQHVDPQESVRIAGDCGAGHLLGVHWGTFALTDEPYREPAELLGIAAAEAGLSAQAFHAGDVWEAA